jgi:glycosyl transferase family 4
LTARLAINGRELTRKPMTSLGYILCQTLPRLANEFEVVVYTPNLPLHHNAETLFTHPHLSQVKVQSTCSGIWGRIFYYVGLYSRVWRTRADWFWEINHVLAPLPYSIKKAVTIHDLYPLHPKLNPSRYKAILFRLNILTSIRIADLAMFPSHAARAELHSRIGVPKGREAVLQNGAYVDLPVTRPASRWQPGSAILGYLGRQNYWKGTDKLLRVMPKSW